jgi:hypothetical protein
MNQTVALGIRMGVWGVFALGGLACGGTTGGPAARAHGGLDGNARADEPFDVQKALAVEAEGLTARPVKSPDGAWSSQALGSAAASVERGEEEFSVNIPIAAEATVVCRVFDETVDTAATLRNIIKGAEGNVQYQQLALAPVQVHAGFPSAGITALYLADTEGGKAVGRLHTVAYRGEHRSLLCWLDDAGYAETFARVAAAFFAGFKLHGVESLATYIEVSKTTMGPVDIGFSLTTMEPAEEEGLRIYSTVSSSFVPRTATDLAYEDTYVVLVLDAKGKLQRGTWVTAETGEELSLNMSLTREKNGKFSYAGQVSGKELSGKLVTPKGLLNSLDVAAMIKKKLAKGEAFSETVPEYHPSIDPTAPVEVTYTHAKDAPPRQVVMRLGEREIVAVADDEGMVKSSHFAMGKLQLSISRQYVRGKP